ncbi:MAG: hypothetical protein IT215_07380 [Chitinophagaceae bacterium]|nr:hypothetical protein [Chitinophagaceae bacterium]
MRKVFFTLALFTTLTSCNTNPFANLFQPEITLCDLYEKQSVFADSLVQLHNLTVTKCSGLFSISYAEVTDGKCSIKLFTTKSYKQNEIVNVKARYKIMFNYNGKTVSALVTDDFPLQPNRILNF